MGGTIDFLGSTVKVALVQTGYTPNQDTHEFFSDITNEATGTGYTAGGATLASKTATYDAGSNTVTLDAADVSWASSTITAYYAVVYIDTGVAGTSPLLGYVDFGESLASSDGTFSIVWNASGILTVTAA